MLCRPHGHRELLHRLEEGGLGLGSGAIDLVREDDLTEQWPPLELEVLSSLAVLHDHRGPENVGRHEVRGELDPGKLQIETPTQRLDQQGLAESRHTLQQGMPPAEKRQEDLLDHVAVSHDDPPDLFGDASEPLAEECRPRFAALLHRSRPPIAPAPGAPPRTASVSRDARARCPATPARRGWSPPPRGSASSRQSLLSRRPSHRRAQWRRARRCAWAPGPAPAHTARSPPGTSPCPPAYPRGRNARPGSWGPAPGP